MVFLRALGDLRGSSLLPSSSHSDPVPHDFQPDARWRIHTLATAAQIEANRRNSMRSTGRRTEAGKSRVRCNPLKHGLTARTITAPLSTYARASSGTAATSQHAHGNSCAHWTCSRRCERRNSGWQMTYGKWQMTRGRWQMATAAMKRRAAGWSRKKASVWPSVTARRSKLLNLPITRMQFSCTMTRSRQWDRVRQKATDRASPIRSGSCKMRKSKPIRNQQKTQRAINLCQERSVLEEENKAKARDQVSHTLWTTLHQSRLTVCLITPVRGRGAAGGGLRSTEGCGSGPALVRQR